MQKFVTRLLHVFHELYVAADFFFDKHFSFLCVQKARQRPLRVLSIQNVGGPLEWKICGTTVP